MKVQKYIISLEVQMQPVSLHYVIQASDPTEILVLPMASEASVKASRTDTISQ